jgi:Hsp70 protein
MIRSVFFTKWPRSGGGLSKFEETTYVAAYLIYLHCPHFGHHHYQPPQQRQRGNPPSISTNPQSLANDQGNRATPSYVSFSDNERLIGDAAKNQVAMNPRNM